jgi:hypothetical protein
MSFSRLRAISLFLTVFGGTAHAGSEAYVASLGPAARTNVNRLIAVGRGSVDAVLDGNKLTISGKFLGLASPATDAHLCIGQGIGVPGSCGSNLNVTTDTSGDLSGSIALDARQMAALPAGQLYVQINSFKSPAPGGNLWGWLLIAHEEVEDDVPQQGHWFLPQYDMPKSVEHRSTHEVAEPKS